MTTLLSISGSVIALVGSIVSIYGAFLYNIYDNPFAKRVWAVSNLLLFAWATGYFLSLWDGGVSGLALVAMYGIYMVLNTAGLRQK